MRGTAEEGHERRLKEIANWLVMLINANESALRPLLDIEHIQVFLMFETLRNAGRSSEMATVISTLDHKLHLRRVSGSGLPFIDAANSLDNVFEQVATAPAEPLVVTDSSYFVLAMLEMCCAFEQSVRDDLLGRIHRHLVLGVMDAGEPGHRKPLDLASWIPPRDWAQQVLRGAVHDGEAVAVHPYGDTRDLAGAEVFAGVRHTVGELRKVDEFSVPEAIPVGALILAALRHSTPLPPELWRRAAFPPAGDSTRTS